LIDKEYIDIPKRLNSREEIEALLNRKDIEKPTEKIYSGGIH